MKKYTLSKDGSELGPFSIEEVIAKITRREVELFDYIFDENQQDWILLTEHAEVTEGLKANKPKARPKVASAESPPIQEETKPSTVSKSERRVISPHGVEWYVLKGESQFGPFDQEGMVRLMQEKTLFEFDFIWNSSMSDWKRLIEVPEFNKESIKSLLQNPKAKASFFDRQHSRAPFEGRVIVHDHKGHWLASGKEISEGGMGLYIADSLLVPGQVLNFHVKAQNGQTPFNVKGEIVSKQYIRGARGKKQKIEYGVKFIGERSSTKEINKAG
ncbi:MAG: DUF4339 domain-containing protein [Bdellovibrionales bacterium]|nr:DUF4339 domain-containing protein [Bdellovibrionales bacterium]